MNGLSTLDPGDTVLFQGGQTFAGTTLVPPQEGTSDLPVTFGAYGGGNATVTATAVPAVQATSTGGLTFTNLTCTGTAPSGDYNGGIHCESGDGAQHPAITFTSCTFTGFQFGVAALADTNWDGYGTVTITGCTLNSNTYGGVWMAAQGAATACAFGTISMTGNTCSSNPGADRRGHRPVRVRYLRLRSGWRCSHRQRVREQRRIQPEQHRRGMRHPHRLPHRCHRRLQPGVQPVRERQRRRRHRP